MSHYYLNDNQIIGKILGYINKIAYLQNILNKIVNLVFFMYNTNFYSENHTEVYCTCITIDLLTNRFSGLTFIRYTRGQNIESPS